MTDKTADKTYYRHIWQLADHFRKTPECIKYHIAMGNLPDPRLAPVDPDTLVFPKPKPRGARLNVNLRRKIDDPANKHKLHSEFITIAEIVDMLNILADKIKVLEERLEKRGD